MKYIHLIFLFFFIHSTSAQEIELDSTNFFFQTSFDSLGICYGKSLQQPILKEIEKECELTPATQKLKPVSEIIREKVELDFYYLPKGHRRLEWIKNYSIFEEEMIKIKDETRMLDTCTPEQVNSCYETVTETYIKKPEMIKWQTNKEIINSSSWIKKETINQEEYGTISKKIIVVPDCCGTREIIIPAHYKTIIKVSPIKGISEINKRNIKSLCLNWYYKLIEKKTTELIDIPAINTKIKEYIIEEEAKIINQRIYCNLDQNTIKKIQLFLIRKKLYQGDLNGELNRETKKAIINFQIQNNLPFGQLDYKTVYMCGIK